MSKITIPQGDTKGVKFTLTQDGVAWDVSSYTHKLYVKNEKDETAELLVELDGVVGGGDNDEVTFSFTHDDTSGLEVQKYWYDYKVFAADESLVRTVVVQGVLDVVLVLEKDLPTP
jgi:hypothetical protein